MTNKKSSGKVCKNHLETAARNCCKPSYGQCNGKSCYGDTPCPDYTVLLTEKQKDLMDSLIMLFESKCVTDEEYRIINNRITGV